MLVVRTIVERAPHVNPARVDEVIFGNANGAGEDNRNALNEFTLQRSTGPSDEPPTSAYVLAPVRRPPCRAIGRSIQRRDHTALGRAVIERQR